jgi:hypothetical protein
MSGVESKVLSATGTVRPLYVAVAVSAEDPVANPYVVIPRAVGVPTGVCVHVIDRTEDAGVAFVVLSIATAI